VVAKIAIAGRQNLKLFMLKTLYNCIRIYYDSNMTTLRTSSALLLSAACPVASSGCISNAALRPSEIVLSVAVLVYLSALCYTDNDYPAACCFSDKVQEAFPLVGAVASAIGQQYYSFKGLRVCH
jgi:hypothetical protein